MYFLSMEDGGTWATLRLCLCVREGLAQSLSWWYIVV